MKLKMFALLGALVMAAPIAAEAAPAGALTAHNYADLASATPAASGAAVEPGGPTAKVEKVWYYRRFGFYRPFYRRFGFYRPYYRYRFYRPYYGYRYYRRPFYGYYRRPFFFRRRFFFY